MSRIHLLNPLLVLVVVASLSAPPLPTTTSREGWSTSECSNQQETRAAPHRRIINTGKYTRSPEHRTPEPSLAYIASTCQSFSEMLPANPDTKTRNNDKIEVERSAEGFNVFPSPNTLRRTFRYIIKKWDEEKIIRENNE